MRAGLNVGPETPAVGAAKLMAQNRVRLQLKWVSNGFFTLRPPCRAVGSLFIAHQSSFPLASPFRLGVFS